MLLVYTIVKPAADYGWGDGRTLSLGSASLGLLAAFIWREATARTPLIPLRIFRSRNVSGANAIQALIVAGMFGMFFMGSLYMQRVLGYDALEIGLAFLPVTLIIGTLSLGYSDRLVLRFGRAGGAAAQPRADRRRAGAVHAGSGGRQLRRPTCCRRCSCSARARGSLSPSLMTLAMGGVAESDAGLASGLVNTTLQVGGALGLAVLATLSTTRSENLLESGRSTAVGVDRGLPAGVRGGRGPGGGGRRGRRGRASVRRASARGGRARVLGSRLAARRGRVYAHEGNRPHRRRPPGLPCLRASLLELEGFEVLGEAGDAEEGIAATRRLNPDIVLLDIQLPGIDGIQASGRIAALNGSSAVVLISSRDPHDFGGLDDGPARGFIPKAELSGEAIRALVA